MTTTEPGPTGVVVGVVGTPSGEAALLRGVREARERGLPLTLLRTWDLYPVYDPAVLALVGDVERAEAGVLREAVDRATGLGATAAGVLHRGTPEEHLVEASRSARLLVLGGHDGHRAHSGHTTFLGRVLGHVTARAACPVMVVPAHEATGTGVVVGVDGSPVSQAALAWAAERAARDGVELVAVLSVPPVFDAYLPDPQVLDQVRSRGARHLAEQLAGLADRYPDLPVRLVVSLDAPLPALLDAAEDAALVVVGSHGRGPVRRAALGSVSSALVRCAPCPVVVVRPDAAGTAHGRAREAVAAG